MIKGRTFEQYLSGKHPSLSKNIGTLKKHRGNVASLRKPTSRVDLCTLAKASKCHLHLRTADELPSLDYWAVPHSSTEKPAKLLPWANLHRNYQWYSANEWRNYNWGPWKPWKSAPSQRAAAGFCTSQRSYGGRTRQGAWETGRSNCFHSLFFALTLWHPSGCILNLAG